MVHETTHHDFEQREIAIELAADLATVCGTIHDSQTLLTPAQRKALEVAIVATRVLRERFGMLPVGNTTNCCDCKVEG